MANTPQGDSDSIRETLLMKSDDELVILLAFALGGDRALPGVFDGPTAVGHIREEQARRKAKA